MYKCESVSYQSNELLNKKYINNIMKRSENKYVGIQSIKKVEHELNNKSAKVSFL